MQNMTTTRAPTKEMVVFAANVHNITELDLARAQLVGIELSVSTILRGVGWATGLGGMVSIALGCYEVIAAAYGGLQSTAISKASCIIDAASGLISLGGSGVAFYLAQRADLAAARVTTIAYNAPLLPDPSSTFGQSFAESIEMHGFRGLGRREDHPWKRDLQGRGLSDEEEWDQNFHNHVTAAMIRNADFGHSEFLGYADDKHQLSKRDGVHALVPRFKFEHPRDGHVVLSTKFTNTTSHIAIEPFIEGTPNIHRRWQEQYRKEVIEDGRLLEGRFDHEAAIADPSWQDITERNVPNGRGQPALHPWRQRR